MTNLLTAGVYRAGLVVICAAVFFFRGPYRALHDTGVNDLFSPYVQSIAWIHGLDPYSPRSLLAMWPQNRPIKPDPKQFEDGSILIRHGIPTAYPITSFVLLAPLALLAWPTAKIIWLIVSCFLFVAALRALVLIAELRSAEQTIFLSVGLLLAPVHTGLAVCNPTVVAAELGVLSFWLHRANKPILAGLLASTSLGLKPQIGICFLVVFLVARNWKSAGICITAVLTLAMGTMLRLSLAHTTWVASYERDNQALLVNGVLGDFTDINPTRSGLVNLQVALYPIFGSRQTSNALAWLTCVLLIAVALRKFWQTRAGDELLFLSTISVLSLLPVYHRFYDAALLIVPLAWLLSRMRGLDLPASASFAVVAAFLVPGGTLLQHLRDRNVLPASLTSKAGWDAMVMAHEPWLLLVLVLILIRCIAREGRVPEDSQSRVSRCQAA